MSNPHNIKALLVGCNYMPRPNHFNNRNRATPENVFKEEALDASDNPNTLVIDKQELEGLSGLAKADNIIEEAHDQLPEDAAQAYTGNLGTLQKLSLAHKFQGSAASSKDEHIQHNDELVTVCVIQHGNIEEASFKKRINLLAGATGVDAESIEKNFKGNIKDYGRFTGGHEGEHCNGINSDHPADRLMLETHADESGYANIDTTTKQELMDYRSLASFYGDIKHATTPLLNGNHPETGRAEVAELHIGAARIYGDLVRDYLDGAKLGETLEQTPEKYFEAASEMTADLAAAAENMPDAPEKLKQIVLAEAITNYTNDFEDAYRRRILGQDAPVRDYVELASPDQKEAYYNNVHSRDYFEDANTEEVLKDVKDTIELYKPNTNISNGAILNMNNTEVTAPNVDEQRPAINITPQQLGG